MFQMLFLSLGVFAFANIDAQESVYQLADRHISEQRYLLAISLLESDLKDNPQEINNLHLLARAYELNGDIGEARICYDKLVQHDKAEPDFYFEYADFLRRNLELEEAKTWFIRYAEFNPTVGQHFAQTCDYAMAELSKVKSCNAQSTRGAEQIIQNPIAVEEISEKPQEEPSIHAATAMIKGVDLYNSKNSERALGLIEASWKSEQIQDYSRSGSRVVYSQINGNRHDILWAEIDKDGKWIHPTTLKQVGGTWSDINPILADGGQVLFFASNRPGGMGGFDLYISNWNGKDWSEPENLGAVINTPGEEISPYYQAGTLYFSSDWHQGLGGFDVFKVGRGGLLWSNPENLGACVNSPADELEFRLDENQDGHFRSNKNGNPLQLDWFKTEKINLNYKPETISQLVSTEIRIKSPQTQQAVSKLEKQESPVTEQQEAVIKPVATAQQTSKKYYIQIAALSQFNAQVSERMKKFTRFGDVYRFETENGIHKIRVGAFDRLNEANAVLSKMKKAGIKDVFVVADLPVEGKTHLIAKNTGEIQSSTGGPVVQEDGKYKIRVGEFKAPEWVDPTPIKDLGTIEHWTRSGWTILILGSFQTVYDATLALDKVKARGYKEAYIVIEEDGKLYKY